MWKVVEGKQPVPVLVWIVLIMREHKIPIDLTWWRDHLKASINNPT
jgi:hypothetical protein